MAGSSWTMNDERRLFFTKNEMRIAKKIDEGHASMFAPKPKRTMCTALRCEKRQQPSPSHKFKMSSVFTVNGCMVHTSTTTIKPDLS